MNKEYCIFVGKEIKKIRKEKKLSQMELEMSAGIDFGVVCRVENAKINITVETLFKIIKALDPKDSDILTIFGINKV